LGVTEPQRLALHKAARATLGEEEGDTLMALTPPSNTDMATRQDLDRVEERLDAKIDAVAQRLDAKIDAVAQRLDAKIDAVAQRLDARIEHSALEVSSVLTKRIHHAELRTIGVIIVAVLGSNLIG